jgi:hypothetical protein
MKDHKTAGGFPEVGSRKRVPEPAAPGEPQNIDALASLAATEKMVIFLAIRVDLFK